MTDHLILPSARLIACPSTVALSLAPVNGGKVSRKSVSPDTAMPPCPSLGSGARQRMFSPAATLQWTGASATFTRNVPSGPPACGQLATDPAGGGGIIGPLA